MNVAPVHRPVGRRDGFTLIEVILAIVIAVGLLTVVLFFYRQAADLRGQVVVESERIASVRLVMSRLTDEIRTVVPSAGPGNAPLVGNSQSIRLIRAAVPARTAWGGGALGRALGADADLTVIGYRSAPGTNAPGLFRSEQVLAGAPPPLRTPDPFLSGTNGPSGDTNAPMGGSAVSPPPETDLFASETNTPGSGALTNGVPGEEILLSDLLPFARFRFWDGAAWRDSWADSRLPMAVEVVLALEMPPVDAPPGSLPEVYFRRVVTVPAAWGGGSSTASTGPSGGDPLEDPFGDPFSDPFGDPGDGGAAVPSMGGGP